ILWRSWEYKEQAAEALRLTANDLVEQGIVDRIVPEPAGGAQRDHQKAAAILKDILLEELVALKKLKADRLVKQRIEKFAGMGSWKE
ncbi:MAG: acetyl-CoA carboxylase carboxyl transferase subunit alpha, partial [Bacteroidota bacterium]